MSPASVKVSLEISADLVARLRAEVGGREETDAALVERAVNAYLLGRLVERVQAGAGLGEDAADELAVAEVKAVRAAGSRVG